MMSDDVRWCQMTDRRSESNVRRMWNRPGWTSEPQMNNCVRKASESLINVKGSSLRTWIYRETWSSTPRMHFSHRAKGSVECGSASGLITGLQCAILTALKSENSNETFLCRIIVAPLETSSVSISTAWFMSVVSFRVGSLGRGRLQIRLKEKLKQQKAAASDSAPVMTSLEKQVDV